MDFQVFMLKTLLWKSKYRIWNGLITPLRRSRTEGCVFQNSGRTGLNKGKRQAFEKSAAEPTAYSKV
jgi:hypothetical protein